ncbi:CHAT domain-containing protein [Streptomyces sp. NPDC002742]|uniref:CHAT domain-containing protein n=1 Tax=Streptomyces sp. NPDC002742 TaxID=3364663 RepID=UPI00369F1B9B
MRDELVAKVFARLGAARGGSGREILLSMDALAEVVALLGHRRKGQFDLQAIGLSAGMFLERSLVGPPGQDMLELEIAGQLFGPVYAVTPDLVPEQMSRVYRAGHDPLATFSRQTGFVTDPTVWLELHGGPLLSYADTGDLATLRLAVDILELALVAATPDHPELTRVLKQLLVVLSVLRAASHERDVCMRAVDVGGLVHVRMRPEEADRPLMDHHHDTAMYDLAGRDRLRAMASGEVDHRFALMNALMQLGLLIDEVQPLLKALDLYGELPEELKSLAVGHLSAVLTRLLASGRGERATAVARCHDLLASSPPHRPTETAVLLVLCQAALEDLAEESDIDGLRRAVGLSRRLLTVAQDGGTQTLARIYLAAKLGRLAQQTHDLDPAREAVALARTAVESIQQSDPAKARLVRIALSEAHRTVYELTDDLEALHEAVHESRLAIEVVNDADAVAASGTYLSHAKAVHYDGGRRQSPELLEEALTSLKRANEFPDLPAAQRMAILHLLTRVLGDIFRRSPHRSVATIDEAVEYGEQARALVPPGGPEEPMVLCELARVQVLRGVATGDVERLRAAIGLAEQVLARADVAMPGTLVAAELERVTALGNLARVTKDPSHALEARAGFDRVIDSPYARLDVRTTAAVLRSQLPAPTAGRTLDDLAEMIDLRRLNVASGPLRADRENVLRRYRGFTGQLIEAGIAAEDPVRTVELIERSRGLLSQDVMTVHPGASGTDPSQTAELLQLTAALRALDLRDSATGTSSRRRELERDIAQERRRLMDRWRNLHATAAPDAQHSLADAAAQGPIALIATGDEKGYAVLVTADADRPVRILELPELAHEPTQERVLTFLTARHYALTATYTLRVRLQAQAAVRDTLAWLWTAAAEPILAELGLEPVSQGGDWPRMWWCPLGFLSHLPWHATGNGTADGVLDRVVSSYTTSLRALHFVRQMPESTGPSRTVIVAQAQAPATVPLRGVDTEVAAIRHWLPDASLLTGTEATKQAFLAALESHANVHLACHAVTDIHSPGMSRLLLADHEGNPLTMAELAALQLAGRELAVLSACSTAETGSDLTDEGLHLTGALQLAGFRHVIGALWPVSDATAGEIFDTFYSHLTDAGSRELRVETSAHALHLAVRRLREHCPATPTVWASFVHTGA